MSPETYLQDNSFALVNDFDVISITDLSYVRKSGPPYGLSVESYFSYRK